MERSVRFNDNLVTGSVPNTREETVLLESYRKNKAIDVEEKLAAVTEKCVDYILEVKKLEKELRFKDRVITQLTKEEEEDGVTAQAEWLRMAKEIEEKTNKIRDNAELYKKRTLILQQQLIQAKQPSKTTYCTVL